METNATTIEATAIARFDGCHPVVSLDQVAQVAAVMDSDDEEWIWVGPPLLVDTDASQLYDGHHRQAAIQQLNGNDEACAGWQIPVVDIWDVIDEAPVRQRVEETGDWYGSVQAELNQLPRDTRDALGIDY